MPAGDVIFQRMDVARDAEMAAIARALLLASVPDYVNIGRIEQAG